MTRFDLIEHDDTAPDAIPEEVTQPSGGETPPEAGPNSTDSSANDGAVCGMSRAERKHATGVSVATLLALAYGTRVEDAQERRIAPGNLRTPPKALAPNHRDPWSRPARTVSVIRHGIDWLRRLLLKGRLWSRVWLLPEPWPEPKLNLEITRHVPP